MICVGCGKFIATENHELELCASCNQERRDNDYLYSWVRLQFLKMLEANQVNCPITGKPITTESDVHHKRGRVGYADQWARDNDIPLLLDPRFFLGVSREGHEWIESHPKEARELGYSESRLKTT